MKVYAVAVVIQVWSMVAISTSFNVSGGLGQTMVQ